MISYRRCLYIDQQSRECNTYFGVKDDEDADLKFCPLHSGILGPRQAAVSESAKVDYVNLMAEEAETCTKLISPDQPLDLDNLDKHIAALEAQIELFKSRASAARAVRSGHVQKLTDEQRKELRKIKVPPVQKSNGSKTPQTQEAKEDSALAKLTKTLMAATGKTEAECVTQAKLILGL